MNPTPDLRCRLALPLAIATLPVLALAVQSGFDQGVQPTDVGSALSLARVGLDALLSLVGAWLAADWLVVRPFRALTRASREAAEASSRAHESFATALDCFPALVWRSGPDGRRGYFNQSWLQFTGRTPEQEMGDGWTAGVHPDDLDRYLQTYRLALAAHEPFEAEYRLRRHDGQYRWVADHGRPLFDRAGALAGYVGSCYDVTDRRQMEEALRESRRRLVALIDHLPGVVYRSSSALSRDEMVYLSEGCLELTGYVPQEFVGEGAISFESIIEPDDRARVREEIRRAVALGRPYTLLYRIRTRSGETRRVWEMGSAVLGRDGQPVALDGFITDITEPRVADDETRRRTMLESVGDAIRAIELQQAEAELRRERDFTSAVLDAVPSLVVVADRDGRIIQINRALQKLYGYGAEEVTDRYLWDALVSPEDAEAVQAAVLRLREGGTPLVAIECRWRGRGAASGTVSWSFTAVPSPGHSDDYIIGTGQDVTEQRLREEQLSFLTGHDALTRLPNLRALEERLASLPPSADGEPDHALLCVDADNFALVNDSLMPPAGDVLLCQLAQVVQGHLRQADLLVRVGGDKFAVLLEQTGAAEARMIAERLRLAVDGHRFSVDGRSLRLGVSIGLAPCDGLRDCAALLARADAAMHRAKRMGRNRVAVYRHSHDDPAYRAAASHWAGELREVLRENRLLLYYQPVVRLSAGTVEHHEALLRLRKPNGEIIRAGEFLPAAEQFGLMPQITRWVVQAALRKLQRSPGLRLFVNLSAYCIADDELLAYVEERLREADVEPGRLGFEITETAAIQDLETAERWMRRLKALGCRFALDDFGVGYSSLAHLRRLPIDELKIDGSLVQPVATDVTQLALVQTIQRLAGLIGVEVVAEYVDSAATAESLRRVGVALGQGDYLSPPAPEPVAGKQPRMRVPGNADDQAAG